MLAQKLYFCCPYNYRKVKMTYTKVILKPHKDEPVLRRHPWIFSGAIASIEGKSEEGEIVEVFSYKGTYLATGYLCDGSIAVKLISFQQCKVDVDFWTTKLTEAYTLRKHLGLTDNPHTNCYLLVSSEGDGLPGLVIDFYAGTAVIQTHSVGIHDAKPQIVEALKNLYGSTLLAVYDKSADAMARQTSLDDLQDAYLWGNSGRVVAKENARSFVVDWEHGQKTGFFLDQRDNRSLLTNFVQGKRVLNTFCYTGGFSVYALTAGAAHVDSVDCSQQALDILGENLTQNSIKADKHTSHCVDAKMFLRDMDEQYDVIILDPPAFAKNLKCTHNALNGYKHLNAMALKKIKKGGVLFTFSCSQAVGRPLFSSAITNAAIETGRNIRVLYHLSQAADHPTSIYHPEGLYLKGLVVYVE